jgi:hypothetical protein
MNKVNQFVYYNEHYKNKIKTPNGLKINAPAYLQVEF